METSANDELIGLLSWDEQKARMLALNWLAEGYAQESAITAAVFDGWQKWGVAQAFPEFPLLSTLPVAEEQIEESCTRAMHMAEGRRLIEPETRSAGKLIEQVCRLPATSLQPYEELLRTTLASSKIFFRTPMSLVEQRLAMLDLDADRLANQLEESIGQLSENAEDAVAACSARDALEALRRYHPNYMHLSGVLASMPPEEGPGAISFQLTLHSLAQFSEPGLEPHLAKYLVDSRASVFVPAIDALVRSGTRQAAEVLLEEFPGALLANQQWIARGLQRIRVKGLADRIAALRADTIQPNLWVMLLVAELRQVDPTSTERLASDLSRLVSPVDEVNHSLFVYTRLLDDQSRNDFQTAHDEYLSRADSQCETGN